jgi:histidinol dehydrogenase
MIEIIGIEERDRRKARLQRLRERSVALNSELIGFVTSIIDDVRTRGDVALIEYAARFDGCQLTAADLRIDEGTLRSIASQVEPDVLESLREAIERVRIFHQFELPRSWQKETTPGVFLGQRITPLELAGLYVPGGSASYPSSVVMNVVPAQVAGVERLIVATPPQNLQKNPAVAAALIELGIVEVYAVGGAQAIAALAYGTETIPAVDKITGPGNKYVAAAKKLVYGVVGIDSIAGPTEVVIIADETAQPSFIAGDLLAQSEHAEDAAALLITTSEALANRVAAELVEQSRTLPRIRVIERSISEQSAIIVVRDLSEACEIVNELAPEHLEIMARDEELLAAKIRNAGAIFFGEHTPEAVGDYLAGPNHVLPTCRAARFSSALSVHDFVKRTSTIKFSSAALSRTAPLIAVLARAEGFEAHARSALIRQETDK